MAASVFAGLATGYFRAGLQPAKNTAYGADQLRRRQPVTPTACHAYHLRCRQPATPTAYDADQVGRRQPVTPTAYDADQVRPLQPATPTAVSVTDPMRFVRSYVLDLDDRRGQYRTPR